MEGGPPGFPPDFTCPAVLGHRSISHLGSAYGALTRYGRPSHAVPLPCGFATPPERAGSRDGSPRNPRAATPCRLHVRGFGLGPLSLAATRGISVDFSSSGYLDVSVPRVAPVRPMRSGGGARAWPLAGSPIRRSPDRGPCAPPRGLSQLAASFVDFRCQGIRLAPLVSSSRGPP